MDGKRPANRPCSHDMPPQLATAPNRYGSRRYQYLRQEEMRYVHCTALQLRPLVFRPSYRESATPNVKFPLPARPGRVPPTRLCVRKCPDGSTCMAHVGPGPHMQDIAFDPVVHAARCEGRWGRTGPGFSVWSRMVLTEGGVTLQWVCIVIHRAGSL